MAKAKFAILLGQRFTKAQACLVIWPSHTAFLTVPDQMFEPVYIPQNYRPDRIPLAFRD